MCYYFNLGQLTEKALKMFRGATKIRLDDKGRMVLPTKYRELLGNGAKKDTVVVTAHPGRFLLVYPAKNFAELEKRIKNMPDSGPMALYYKQMLIGHADEMSLDSAGRILINTQLAIHAGIGKDALAMGLYDHIRLWDEERWKQFCKEMSVEKHFSAPPEGWEGFAI